MIALNLKTELLCLLIVCNVNADPCKQVNYADPNLVPLEAIVRKIAGDRYKVWDGTKWVEVQTPDDVYKVKQQLNNGRLP